MGDKRRRGRGYRYPINVSNFIRCQEVFPMLLPHFASESLPEPLHSNQQSISQSDSADRKTDAVKDARKLWYRTLSGLPPLEIRSPSVKVIYTGTIREEWHVTKSKLWNKCSYDLGMDNGGLYFEASMLFSVVFSFNGKMLHPKYGANLWSRKGAVLMGIRNTKGLKDSETLKCNKFSWLCL